MFLIFLLPFFIIFIIQAFFASKLQYDLYGDDARRQIEENNALIDKLKKLSPEQMDKLVLECEEWLHRKNNGKAI